MLCLPSLVGHSLYFSLDVTLILFIGVVIGFVISYRAMSGCDLILLDLRRFLIELYVTAMTVIGKVDHTGLTSCVHRELLLV